MKKCRTHLEKDGLAFNIRQPYLESIPIFSSYICVNNIQGRENQAETPEKQGKKRLRIYP